jgi:general secretion pathway protein G
MIMQQLKKAWRPFNFLIPQKTVSFGRRAFSNGFTLVELIITVAIVSILATIAIPAYEAATKKSRFSSAKRDILEIQMQMERYYTQRNRFPVTLDEITSKPDPWGNAYRYLDMAGATVGDKRKDKSLHPLNTDYDLYSIGPDGETQTPLTAPSSRDDIVRANNGGFIGWGADF